MHRTYIPSADFQSSNIQINDPKEFHHLKNVLRLKPGDAVQIFNGCGEEADAVIETIAAKQMNVSIRCVRKTAVDSKSIRLILACAIPKKAKFEFIIEKCTELGVDEIIPLQTARTEVVLTEDRAHKKSERFQTVALNAAKQCQRVTVPLIHPVSLFSQVIEKFDSSAVKFIPCLTGERKGLDQVLRDVNAVRTIVFFIGPEGDFTPQELKMAIGAGCVPVSLGATTLKVDTAAIAVVAHAALIMRGHNT